MKHYLLGCDWGTSSFRLCAYNAEKGMTAGEVSSGNGIAIIHGNWQNSGAAEQGITLAATLRNFLLQQVQQLSHVLAIDFNHTPVVISGMASSTIGMEMLPYAQLPFGIAGKDIVYRAFKPDSECPHEILLVSGVQGDHDVMRGEETQIIGLHALLTEQSKLAREMIFILPGTHSKHCFVKNSQLINFKTFITGELYHVLGMHSILKDSVFIQTTEKTDSDLQAFANGIEASGSASLLHTLFTVRTNQLFNHLDKQQNASYLSGLLIGAELRTLSERGTEILLCSGTRLYELYKLALETLGLGHRTRFVPPVLVNEAAMTGQKIIYDCYVAKNNS